MTEDYEAMLITEKMMMLSITVAVMMQTTVSACEWHTIIVVVAVHPFSHHPNDDRR